MDVLLKDYLCSLEERLLHPEIRKSSDEDDCEI